MVAVGKLLAVGLFGEQSHSRRVLASVAAEQLVRVERKILLELYFADLHVVDFGGHFVHAVSRGDGYGVVHFRFAEYPVNQIYRFVRAVAHEDAFHRDALDLRKACLERLLARVGVAVDSVVVRIFVGVEGYAQLGALVIVARGGVGREVADILPYEIAYVHDLSVCAAGAEFVSATVCRPFGDGSLPVLHCFVRPRLLGPAAGRLLRWAITGFRSWRRFHSSFRSRSVTAFLCAPSPSAAAIVSITPPIRCNPAGEIS